MSSYTNDIIEAAEIFKALGHPTRLCILNKLRFTNLNVSQMQDCLSISQSSISQHLNILKSKGIIVGERKGAEIFYSLVDDHVRKLITVYFEK